MWPPGRLALLYNAERLTRRENKGGGGESGDMCSVQLQPGEPSGY
jgi:hypothetical protein